PDASRSASHSSSLHVQRLVWFRGGSKYVEPRVSLRNANHDANVLATRSGFGPEVELVRARIVIVFGKTHHNGSLGRFATSAVKPYRCEGESRHLRQTFRFQLLDSQPSPYARSLGHAKAAVFPITMAWQVGLRT